MVRSELVRKLAHAHPHLSQQVVEAAVEAILNEITDSLAQGKRVEFRGFGAFSSKVRDPRLGRNPRNGDPVQVEAKQVPAFRASKQLLSRLTGNIPIHERFEGPG
ncbi:integration host factor subunit beta (plasmid) [Paracoccus liaowanqingii]|uniref:Integration host factor subunit beta n=1 Tax=Paracoccus liaowanqingii TaxID=2560053 RepID=A0A4Y5STS5_9RHOB|nr:HU family DNA-binding protein [Paracoccus liaowanqingii]QDA36932.1 integration host factor subunit beta [Paracoccus liaowanqingii]